MLKNIRGIRNEAALRAFETISVTQRGDEPLPSGRLSVSHYRAIHRHLFQDVYRWAGAFRTVRIARDGSHFCYPEHIAREMYRLFAWLKEHGFLRDLRPDAFSREAAHFIAELNAIHAFRDGNGRAQLAFLAILAHRAEHPIIGGRLRPNVFIEAMIASFRGDEGPLRREIRALIVR